MSIFRPASFARFITPRHVARMFGASEELTALAAASADLIVPAEHLEPHDGLGDALDDVMAMCADAGLANPNYLDELMRHDDAVAAVYAWAAMSGDNLEDVLTEWSAL